MAVLFWYLLKNNACVLYILYSILTMDALRFTRYTRNTRPCITGHPVPDEGVEGKVEAEVRPQLLHNAPLDQHVITTRPDKHDSVVLVP